MPSGPQRRVAAAARLHGANLGWNARRVGIRRFSPCYHSCFATPGRSRFTLGTKTHSDSKATQRIPSCPVHRTHSRHLCPSCILAMAGMKGGPSRLPPELCCQWLLFVRHACQPGPLLILSAPKAPMFPGRALQVGLLLRPRGVRVGCHQVPRQGEPGHERGE